MTIKIGAPTIISIMLSRIGVVLSKSSLIVCLATALALGVVSSVFGALSEQVSEVVLPNGLKIILLENRKAPLITFQVWYRVGSRNEEWGKTGLSHLLEHMMFKGTEKIGPGEFSRIVEQNGGDENAFTSYDFTAYFENMSSDRVQIPIRLESDRMQGLLLREEDFKTEKSVVMEERRLRTDDNPKAVLQEQLQATAFQVQPYHWPIIGWMQDIARLTVDDLRKYYKVYYNPVNAFIVVVGDFKKEAILPMIEQTFGPIPKGVAPDQHKDTEMPQLGERRIVVRKEAQLASIVKSYYVPNLKSPDSYVLEVIAALLATGETSRLNSNLVREKQLALSVDADNELTSRDPNLFSVAADILPGKTVGQVEKALLEEIKRLQKELVGQRELEKAKNQIEAGFTFGQDSLFYQGMLLAMYEIASSWKDIDKFVPIIRAVTAEDVRRVANKYLVESNCTTAILEPIPSAEPKPVQPGSPSRERTIVR
ncbi:MAG: putative zinc protease AlbF [Syntrophorhabdaceae bacterium PtaU1.Bin034]|nr:MAG: putative zinc protease AlbF [Syntrophorhabdaceae bacterium PtaU1.Bin034]